MKGGVSSGEGIISQVRDEVRGMRKGAGGDRRPRRAGDKRLLLDAARILAGASGDEARGQHAVAGAARRLGWSRPAGDIDQALPDQGDQRLHLDHRPYHRSRSCAAKLDETAMANGFANRFLFACVQRSKVLPFGGALAAEAVAAIGRADQEAIMAAQLSDRRDNECAGASAVARGLSRAGARRRGLLAHITSRAEAQTVRLALLYALLDRAEAIDAVHLEAALGGLALLRGSARYIFGDLLGDPAADTILQTLRRRKPAGMAKREIIDLFGRNLRAAAINAALGLLERTGKVTLRAAARAAALGRPREMWFAP